MTFVEEVPEIPAGATPPVPPKRIGISYESLGLGILSKIPSIMVVGPARTQLMLLYAEVSPVKYFEIKEHFFLFVRTGISGKLRVEINNPTPFATSAEFYNRSYAEGFKLVEDTVSFDLPRMSKSKLDYNWSVGFLDLLVRAFLSLFSAETCCKGYLKIGGVKKDYDVTEVVPVE